jgi:uncharacterized protein (DUF849 family)
MTPATTPRTDARGEPLIVNVALTGMVGNRERVPHLPVTAAQIVADACRCHELGASIVHIHARDSHAKPDWRPQAYEPIVAGIRERCPEVVICVTTSGREVAELDKRAAVLELEGPARPDMASLTLGSLNFPTGPSINAADTVEALAERMASAGIKPELEVFDSGMASEARRLVAAGLIAEPAYANVILGSHHAAPATLRELAHLADSLPEGAVWAAGGIGALQRRAIGMAIFAGGHVRTGLEDNPYLDWSERRPTTNAELVERVVQLAGLAGRPVASAAETRARLGLPPRSPHAG